LDARRFLTQIQADLDRGRYVDPRAGQRTLADFWETWVRIQPWRNGTRARQVSVWSNWVAPTFAERPLVSINRSDVQAWLATLTGRLAASTVEGTFRLLCAVLRAAQHDGLIGRSPCDGVRLPRREGVLREPLTILEVEELAEAIRPELRAAVLFDAMTGLRQGELFGLTEDRLRLLRREVVVDRQLVTPQAGDTRFGPTKTSRSVRVVPLTDRACEIVAEHLDRFPPEQGWVFHRDGVPWRKQRASAAIRAVGGRWHDLRRHAASVLIRDGASVTAVAAALGHSPAECLRTYAGWWPEEGDVVRRAMEKAWGVLPESRPVAESR
jgi:integrase